MPQNSLKIGINTLMLFNALRDNPKTELTLSNTEKYLFLSFSNGINAKIPLIDITDKQEQTIPELKYNTSFKLNSKRFKELVLNMSRVSESSKFITEKVDNKDIVRFSSVGVDITLKSTELSEFNSSETAITKYSSVYLKTFLNSTLVSELVTIEYNTQYPLRLSYAGLDGLKIVYILAPRVEND